MPISSSLFYYIYVLKRYVNNIICTVRWCWKSLNRRTGQNVQKIWGALFFYVFILLFCIYVLLLCLFSTYVCALFFLTKFPSRPLSKIKIYKRYKPPLQILDAVDDSVLFPFWISPMPSELITLYNSKWWIGIKHRLAYSGRNVCDFVCVLFEVRTKGL